MALMALLIQGCRKPADTADNSGADTNANPSLPTNPPPDQGSNAAMTPPPVDTNPPVVQTPPPAPLPPAPPAPTTEDYTVIKGDTFASIAKKSGVTTKAIQEANPGVDAKKLKIGQKLHLPSGGSTANASASIPASAPGAADTSASGGEQTYKVKSGDTLTSIAKHFHVTIKSIQSANHLTTTSIKVGQSLKVPGSAAAAPASAQVEPTLPPPVPVATSAPAPASPMAPAH
jgi:LysM repeat protein